MDRTPAPRPTWDPEAPHADAEAAVVAPSETDGAYTAAPDSSNPDTIQKLAPAAFAEPVRPAETQHRDR